MDKVIEILNPIIFMGQDAPTYLDVRFFLEGCVKDDDPNAKELIKAFELVSKCCNHFMK